MPNHRLYLHKPLERALADGHPWVFRDAVRDASPAPAGTIADVFDRRGRFFARGICDFGPIALRVWTLQDEALDEALFRRRIDEALALRESLAVPETNALRWIHGEGDRLPGFVCDRYDRCVIVAWDGEGVAAHAEQLLSALAARAKGLGIADILVKSGRGQSKKLEAYFGEVPEDAFAVTERGMTLFVDVGRGQKTGLFLDHRDSRAQVRALARDRRVLNLYGYTGGFSVAAGLGDARQVTTVDQSAPALELAQRSWLACGLDANRHRVIAGDVREFLDAESGSAHDLVVSDPPSFAPNRRSVDKALEAYRLLHRAAISAVVPGGLLLAASCSAHVDRGAFDDSLRAGARDAKRHLQVLGRWGAAADHPVPLGFAEGDYLKVTLCRVLVR